MEIVRLSDLSVEHVVRAKSIRATDGIISLLLWESPFEAGTEELAIPVACLTQAEIEPVRGRLAELLGLQGPSLLESLEEG